VEGQGISIFLARLATIEQQSLWLYLKINAPLKVKDLTK